MRMLEALDGIRPPLTDADWEDLDMALRERLTSPRNRRLY